MWILTSADQAGGATGIGAATTRLLVQHGAFVVGRVIANLHSLRSAEADIAERVKHLQDIS